MRINGIGLLPGVDLYIPKIESLACISVADSMGIFFVSFTPLFSKSTQKKSRRTCTKTKFNVKWPFKVIQGSVLWDQWKGDDGLNNTIYVGLIS